MATKIYERTMPNGRQIMVKFGYADNNGEYYTRFADASYQNFDRGATFAAFVASAKPDTIPCWEMDEEYGFRDRALESWEKSDFVEDYLIRHPSREAFDFISKVQDELDRYYSADATVRDFDEDCEIAITSEKDEQDVSVYISFNEGGIINVMGCYNGYDIYQTDFDWSDAKAVADEAWAAFLGLSNYRDCFHLPRINGESTIHIESMDTLKAEFDEKMYKMLDKSFRNYVEYVRELTDDFTIETDKLPINWGYKQNWRDLWVASNVEVSSNFGASSWMIRTQVWTAIAYYHFESNNGRFMCNDTVVKYMLPKFAVDNQVVYYTDCGCAPNTTNILVYDKMDVINNPVHRIGEKICKLANRLKGEMTPYGNIVLKWDEFGEDDAEFIKNNMPHLCVFVYDYSRAFGTYIKRIDIVNDELVVYIQ